MISVNQGIGTSVPEKLVGDRRTHDVFYLGGPLNRGEVEKFKGWGKGYTIEDTICIMFERFFTFMLVLKLSVLSFSSEKYSSQYGEVNHFKTFAKDEKKIPSQIIVIVDVIFVNILKECCKK